MDAANQDSATGDGDGGIARHVKDYCTEAMENLKAGRFKEAYLFANEALELDEKDAKATAIYRHALYALHPKKRLLDKAKTLHEEADLCMKEGDYDKALELISLTKKWHCTPGVLYTRAKIKHLGRLCFDLAYVDLTEGLAECKEVKGPLATGQLSCLSRLGYKVLPVLEPDRVPLSSEVFQMPARYHINNWPIGLRINDLHIYHPMDYARAMKIDGTVLKPHIPLNQLAQFLNHHVQGAMQSLTFGGGDGLEGVVLRLLDEVTVPERLHVDSLNLTDFFLLPWATIERILDGRNLRANKINFFYLQLPSGVDANELLKLPTIRDCSTLRVMLYTRHLPPPPGLPPLFNNAALLEWIKRSDGRSLQLTRDYLSSGLLSFLDALKNVSLTRWLYYRPLHSILRLSAFQDFQQAVQVHPYIVAINCPHINVAELGVGFELLSNRLGEKLLIGVREDPVATDLVGHQFETVFVGRFPPS